MFHVLGAHVFPPPKKKRIPVFSHFLPSSFLAEEKRGIGTEGSSSIWRSFCVAVVADILSLSLLLDGNRVGCACSVASHGHLSLSLFVCACFECGCFHVYVSLHVQTCAYLSTPLSLSLCVRALSVIVSMCICLSMSNNLPISLPRGCCFEYSCECVHVCTCIHVHVKVFARVWMYANP